MKTDTSGMIWVDNVPESGSKYQQGQAESAIEQDQRIQKLISRGYVLGEPRATETFTVDELEEKKVAGLYRPRNLGDNLVSKVNVFFNIS